MFSSKMLSRILVVDDEPVAAELLVTFLEELGVSEIDVAHSGFSALQYATQKTYDLVLVDMRLEEMDGVQLIRELTRIIPETRFIVASGLDSTLLDLAAKALDESGAHVCSVLRKPITFDALEEALSDAIVDRPAAFRPYTAGKVISREETLKHIADGNLQAWFQPKVEISTGIVSSCEALARIMVPKGNGEFEILTPAAFIPSIEDDPHSTAMLTGAMIRSASNTMKEASRNGHPLVCAVNLSRSLFNSKGLFDRILSEAEATKGLHPSFLFEITETAVVDDIGEMLTSLVRLKMRGFKLSIDDFGTGYSSMQALVRIPFDELKIDRSFVNGAAKDERTRKVLAATVTMANSLGMATCAEGIELASEYSLLASMGCSYAQGYLLARPMKGQDLLNLVYNGSGLAPKI